jgi:D-beta-D-heptose 7-phosphate kinase/D-beta-D-heptose 1-phosphate adenosyltransferase
MSGMGKRMPAGDERRAATGDRAADAVSALREELRPGSRASKLLLPVEAFDLRDSWSKAGLRLVFTNGCFDVIHPGHVALLEFARSLGDILLLAVNTDDSARRNKGESHPFNSLADRLSLLAGFASVDFLLAFDEDTPEELLRRLRPEILVKGGDYRPDQVIGREHALETIIAPFVKNYSSSAVLARAARR